MAINKLTAILNLDSAGFTSGLKSATTAMKGAKLSIDEVNVAARNFAKSQAEGVTGIQLANNAYNTSAKGLAALGKSQEAFVTGLKKELETLGLSRAELVRYNAAQLGVTDRAATYISLIEQKSAALDRDAAAQLASTRAIQESIAAYNAHQAAADGLIVSLKDELLVLEQGTRALTLRRAEQLGVLDEAIATIAAIDAQTAANKASILAENEAAEATRKKTAADKAAAEAALKRVPPEEQFRQQLQAQATALKEQIIVARGGTGFTSRDTAEDGAT